MWASWCEQLCDIPGISVCVERGMTPMSPSGDPDTIAVLQEGQSLCYSSPLPDRQPYFTAALLCSLTLTSSPVHQHTDKFLAPPQRQSHDHRPRTWQDPTPTAPCSTRPTHPGTYRTPAQAPTSSTPGPDLALTLLFILITYSTQTSRTPANCDPQTRHPDPASCPDTKVPRCPCQPWSLDTHSKFHKCSNNFHTSKMTTIVQESANPLGIDV